MLPCFMWNWSFQSYWKPPFEISGYATGHGRDNANKKKRLLETASEKVFVNDGPALPRNRV